MKTKPNKIDILAFIACMIIATGTVITVLYGEAHICSWCKKRIPPNEDCVICDGRYYYHVDCYREKLKEESK